MRFELRRSSGAFECLVAYEKLQRTGALQDAPRSSPRSGLKVRDTA